MINYNYPAGYLLPIDDEANESLLVPFEENSLSSSQGQGLTGKWRIDEYAQRAFLLKTKNTALGRAIREGKYDFIRETLRKQGERH